MASYQFVIELIPEQWLHKKSTPIDQLFEQNSHCDPDDCYDLSIAWKSHQPTICVNKLLSHILLEKKSWSKNIKVWGDEKSNDIQILLNNNQIESIKVRLDLRKDIEDLTLKIVDLANQLSCQLFLPQLQKIIPANIQLLNKEILQSSAKKFIEHYNL
jgi:hypothetical protein